MFSPRETAVCRARQAMIERRAAHRIVVRRFQLRFLFANLLHFLFIAAALAATIFGPPAWQLLSSSTSPAERERAATAFLALHGYVWLGLALAFFVGLTRLAVASHRIAGPLVRIVRTMREIRRGDVSMRFAVRETDYLTREAAALDGMTTGLRRRLRAVKERTNRLNAALAGLCAPRACSLEERERMMLAVDTEMRRLRRHLDRFTTERPQTPAADSAASPGTRSAHDVNGEAAPHRRRQQGFTVLEILLVVAIISTVSAIAIPAYGEALNRARVVRAIADIRSMDLAIQRFDLLHGRLPNSLAEASLDIYRDPYGMPYQYLPIRGMKGKGGVRKDHKLNPINSDFDLFSTGRDKVFQIQLTNKDSLDDIVRANDGGFIGLASDY